VFASIPSPSANALSIGPLEIRAYGLMIALGAFAAVTWSQRRYAARGGDAETIASISMWAIPAGLVGSRLYHVATDWR
jgi:prolipoprotein diacylglyceryltransferase